MHPHHLVVVALCALGACGFSVTATTSGEPAPTSVGDVDAGVCSTAGLACAQPGVTISCTGACWVGCREATSYAEAKRRCIAWGGELARIDSAETQQCVNATFAGSARWLGLEQAAGSPLATVGWSWAGDGAVLPYTNWAGGQPNDGDAVEDAEEQCAYMSDPSGAWQDMPCGATTNAFACRR